MAEIYSLYKTAQEPDFVDYGCWYLYGWRPVGSTGPFTNDPIQLIVNGTPGIYTAPAYLGQYWINVQPVNPVELRLAYNCECLGPADCPCDKTAIVDFIFTDCCPGPYEILISESLCNFTLDSVTGLINYSIQWQYYDPDVSGWVDLVGETGNTYLGGLHQGQYRVIITGEDATTGQTGCTAISNIAIGECAPDPCTVTVNSFTYNETLQQFEISYTSSDLTSPDLQLVIRESQQVNPPYTDCDNYFEGGPWSTVHEETLPGQASGTINVPFPQPINQDRCYWMALYPVSNAQCSDEAFEFVNGAPCPGSISFDLISGGDCEYQLIDFKDTQVPNGQSLTPILAPDSFAPFWEADFEWNVSCAPNQFSPHSRQQTGVIWDTVRKSNAFMKNVAVYVGELEVHTTDQGSAILNFNPFNPDPDMLSGPGGVVDPSHLGISLAADGIPTTTDIFEWRDAMIAGFQNAMFNKFGYSIGTNYLGDGGLSTPESIVGAAFEPGSNNTAVQVQFKMTIKHNPTGGWAGFVPNNLFTVFPDDGQNYAQYTGTTWGPATIFGTYQTPCGSISGSIGPDCALSNGSCNVDFNQTKFDEIVFNDPTSWEIKTAQLRICEGGANTLVLILNNITSESILWSNDQDPGWFSTESVIEVVSGVTYTVVVTDGDNGCEYEQSYLVP